MITPYLKKYIRFTRVEEAQRSLIYAILLENNGHEEIALCEPQLIRVILKASRADTLSLPATGPRRARRNPLIISPFTKPSFVSLKIPAFSYARPPTEYYY